MFDKKYCQKQIIERSFQTLFGLLEGIDADKQINAKEVDSLKHWFSDHLYLKDKKPFDEIFNVFSEMLADSQVSREEFQDLKWLCGKYKDEGDYYNHITKEIQFLHGLVAGVAADNEINEMEMKRLNEWLMSKECLKNHWPYDEIYGFCMRVMADGKIDNQEKNAVISFFKEFQGLNKDDSEEHSVPIAGTLNGICAMSPEITFEYKHFVITGKSSKATRAQIQKLIEDCAGTVDERITYKTDYLIVMAEGNQAWAYTSYGRKIEEAMHLRSKGKKLLIICEADLWDALYDADVA